MPAGSLLTLLDDIATILDDVSILTKKAAAKISPLFFMMVDLRGFVKIL